MKCERQSAIGNPAGGGTPALHKRKHLRRLDTVFERWRAPLYFLTICVHDRKSALCNPQVYSILITAWKEALTVHGWMAGRYVVMPNHVYFFAAPMSESAKDLSGFVGNWKNWTQRQIRESGCPSFEWQKEFFDHLMRSSESYSKKWEYVRLNPARAGLVQQAEDWPHQGEIHYLEW